MRSSLEHLDFFVNVDLFLTDTCKQADIVLPACSSVERSEPRCYGIGYAIFTQPAIPPLYQSRSDVDVIYALAERLCPDDQLMAQGYNLLTGKQEIIGLWANARHQGYTAGCNMAGVPREYAGEIPHNITHFMGMDFVGLGEVSDTHRREVWEDGDSYAALFYREERLCGVNLLDRFAESGVVKHALVKGLLLEEQPSLRHGLPLQEHLLRQLISQIQKGKEGGKSGGLYFRPESIAENQGERNIAGP